MAVTSLLLMAGCGRPPAIDDRSAGRAPVLFVHGSGLDQGLWANLQRRLLEAGYSTEELLAVDMKPADGSNVRASRIFIEPAVQQLLQQSARLAKQRGHRPPERVDIVAHSMGAISSRWFIRFGQPERVRLWIGIAPANHGTNALCGFAGAGDRELCPAFADSSDASPVQVRLNGTPHHPTDITPFGLGTDAADVPSLLPDAKRCIAYFTVRIEPDEWIKPERSAMLQGAGGLPVSAEALSLRETSAGNYLFTAATSHDELPEERDIAELIKLAAQAADQGYARACAARSSDDAT